MARTRRRFDAKFKAKVALEAIRGLKAISEIAQQFKVHPNQVTTWKKQLLGGAELAFESGSSSSKKKNDEPEAAELYEQIGRLKVELEWLKKKSCRELVRSLCSGSIANTKHSAFGGSARFWASIDRSCITHRSPSRPRIWN